MVDSESGQKRHHLESNKNLGLCFSTDRMHVYIDQESKMLNVSSFFVGPVFFLLIVSYLQILFEFAFVNRG